MHSTAIDLRREPVPHEPEAPLRLHARRHLPVLDGIRGLAILLVLLHHFGDGASRTNALGQWYFALVDPLWLGVDLFFVLSGFLITGILFDSRESRGFFRNFYGRRAVRIFPLYYGLLLAVFCALPLLRPFIRQAAGQNLGEHQWNLWLYLTNFAIAREGFGYFWAFDHFWSLAVEEHFYLAWPLVIFFCDRRGAMRMCGACIGMSIVLRIALTAAGTPPVASYVMTFCRLDGLALGAFAALAIRGPGGIAAWRPWVMPSIAIASITLALTHLYNGRWIATDRPVQLIGFPALALLFTAAIVGLVAAPAKSPGNRLLCLAPIRWAGKYAYALYVFHPLLIIPLRRLFEHPRIAPLHGTPAGILLYTGLGIACSFMIAILSWHLYEKHFLKLKRFLEYKEWQQPQTLHPAPSQALAA